MPRGPRCPSRTCPRGGATRSSSASTWRRSTSTRGCSRTPSTTPERWPPPSTTPGSLTCGNLGRSKAFTKGDESYSDLVGRIFLDPFELHERQKFFTFEPEALHAIRRANPALSADDFIPISRRRPYLIVAGTLLGGQIDADPNERYFFEATPLYVGTRAEATVRVRERLRHKNVLIGGGYVESFGYDSYPPEGASANGLWKVRLKGRLTAGDLASDRRYRFSLSDMIGMSSAAPLVLLTDYNVPNAFFPEFRHWAIDRERVAAVDDLEDGAGDFQHGDGADTDNLALLPLLARRVENILVFVNTPTPFPDKPDCTAIDEDVLVDDVISFFRPIGKLAHNHAFDRAGLAELCSAFDRRRQDGEPLVHCQEYSVLPNSPAAVRYSIPAYATNVCWAYLDAPRAWLDRLPPGGGDLADLRAGEGDFDHFPHYRTFGEHGVGVIDLDRERVHALSNLTAWAMLTWQARSPRRWRMPACRGLPSNLELGAAPKVRCSTSTTGPTRRSRPPTPPQEAPWPAPAAETPRPTLPGPGWSPSGPSTRAATPPISDPTP